MQTGHETVRGGTPGAAIVRGARRGIAAAGGGLLALAGVSDAAARPGRNRDGDHKARHDRDDATPKDDSPRGGGRDRADGADETSKGGGRDQPRAKDDAERSEAGQRQRDDPDRRDAAQGRRTDDDQTREDRRADRDARRDETERDARREDADQTAGDDPVADDGPTHGLNGLAERLREQAESFRARQDATVDGETAAGDDDLVDISVDLQQDPADAISVDLNLPDLSALLADLPDIGAAVDDDISFARSGDSIAVSGADGAFAGSTGDDGGDSDVDFSS